MAKADKPRLRGMSYKDMLAFGQGRYREGVEAAGIMFREMIPMLMYNINDEEIFAPEATLKEFAICMMTEFQNVLNEYLDMNKDDLEASGAMTKAIETITERWNMEQLTNADWFANTMSVGSDQDRQILNLEYHRWCEENKLEPTKKEVLLKWLKEEINDGVQDESGKSN